MSHKSGSHPSLDHRAGTSEQGVRNTRPLVTAGILLGLGLGGFFDGILFHQVLRWHHMLSSAGYPPTTVANLQVNVLWDGLFHTFTWLVTVVGVVALWRTGRRRDVPWSPSIFAGALLVGWGLFNLVEGIVDHHILGLHHVREGVPDQLAWDLGFLAFGAALVVIGWLLVRSGAEKV